MRSFRKLCAKQEREQAKKQEKAVRRAGFDAVGSADSLDW
jgi:hypothetical protein